MPRNITVTFADGSSHVYQGAPDDVTPDQVEARASKEFGKKVASLDGGRGAAPEPSMIDSVKQGAGNLVAGAVRGAGSIGASILYPVDKALDLVDRARGISDSGVKGLVTGEKRLTRNEQRRADMDAGLQSMGADPDSLLYKGGKLAGEIAGTAGAGGAVANVLGRSSAIAAAAPNVLRAISTSGMSGGAATGIANPLVRAIGGGVSGAVSAGMVDPETAGTGAAVGAALPGALKVAGIAGRGIGSAASKAGRAIVPQASPDVAALAQRAQQLGIDVPVDRIVNSKPLNALAASLNYVPFSGRAATEANMAKGLDTAVSRTFGQNSDNVTQALRKAADDLGKQFDSVLQANTVKMTPTFKQALADAETQANSELGSEAASVIRKQIAAIQTKGVTGEIDGQTAYNIKKALDRIGGGSSDAAFYARDLKKQLMAALNDSLGPAEAAAFAKTRQQYGNMLALENLAQNGAEGGISAARLANMKNIGNADLQELADIAAQFMRTRESPHGALQRLVIGGAATAGGGISALPVVAGTAVAGRGANMLLNSQAAKNAALGVRGSPNALSRLLANPDAAQMGYRVAPVLAADQ
jgi:hypothetical protein